MGSAWGLLLPGHPCTPQQPAHPSCCGSASEGENGHPLRISSDPVKCPFSTAASGTGLHPSRGSAQSQPELKRLHFSPGVPLSGRRHGLQGSLHDPTDLYRLLLAVAPCWLHFKAGAARLLQVSEAAGTFAEGLWQEGVLSQLPSTGKQHMWMTSSPRESFLRPLGWGQV